MGCLKSGLDACCPSLVAVKTEDGNRLSEAWTTLGMQVSVEYAFLQDLGEKASVLYAAWSRVATDGLSPGMALQAHSMCVGDLLCWFRKMGKGTPS